MGMKEFCRIKKGTILPAIYGIIAVLGLYMYIRFNPPLEIGGISWERGGTGSTVEIINTGFADISIEKVLVNNGEVPVKVELGMSRTGHLVLGAGLDGDPYITFRSIKECTINPELSPKERQQLAQSKDNKIVKHYGLRISHDKPLYKIIIIYRYLGIQLRYEAEI